MTERIDAGGLRVARTLHDFIEDEALPGTGVARARFWPALAAIVHELAPRNRELLTRRDALQARIDAWHLERRGQLFDPAAYKSFLGEIGYLLPEGGDNFFDFDIGSQFTFEREAGQPTGKPRALVLIQGQNRRIASRVSP